MWQGWKQDDCQSSSSKWPFFTTVQPPGVLIFFKKIKGNVTSKYGDVAIEYVCGRGLSSQEQRTNARTYSWDVTCSGLDWEQIEFFHCQPILELYELVRMAGEELYQIFYLCQKSRPHHQSQFPNYIYPHWCWDRGDTQWSIKKCV